MTRWQKADFQAESSAVSADVTAPAGASAVKKGDFTGKLCYKDTK